MLIHEWPRSRRVRDHVGLLPVVPPTGPRDLVGSIPPPDRSDDDARRNLALLQAREFVNEMRSQVFL